MLTVNLPGRDPLELAHLVLDLNGTIAFHGKIFPGVPDLLSALQSKLEIHVVSADTRGTLSTIAAELGVRYHRLPRQRPEPDEKAEYIQKLGPGHVVFVGNGANDQRALAGARVGIVVVGSEGAAVPAILGADVVVTSPLDALALLRDPRALVATIRT